MTDQTNAKFYIQNFGTTSEWVMKPENNRLKIKVYEDKSLLDLVRAGN